MTPAFPLVSGSLRGSLRRSRSSVVVSAVLFGMTIPALVNTFIAFFKDTSLVAIVGLFDLLGAAKAVNVDPKWFGFSVEVYLFAGAVYFVFCYAVSQYTQRLERFLKVAAAR